MASEHLPDQFALRVQALASALDSVPFRPADSSGEVEEAQDEVEEQLEAASLATGPVEEFPLSDSEDEEEEGSRRTRPEVRGYVTDLLLRPQDSKVQKGAAERLATLTALDALD
ncbi:unnamed protein product [Effrenium voratum]|nr:unnamed protein product [Effrenium voratum]